MENRAKLVKKELACRIRQEEIENRLQKVRDGLERAGAAMRAYGSERHGKEPGAEQTLERVDDEIDKMVLGLGKGKKRKADETSA